MEDIKILEKRKEKIEAKLKKYGIQNYEIQYLPYLSFDPSGIQSSQNVARRVIILYALSHGTSGFIARFRAKKWLMKENLWQYVENGEKAFFSSFFPNYGQKMQYSWAIESAIVLNWALAKTDYLPEVIEEISEENIQNFLSCIPKLGTSTKEYIETSKYRSLEEIFEENILNELITAYLRDLLFSGGTPSGFINQGISYERHRALNWVRQFSGIPEWEEIDTST